MNLDFAEIKTRLNVIADALDDKRLGDKLLKIRVEDAIKKIDDFKRLANEITIDIEELAKDWKQIFKVQ